MIKVNNVDRFKQIPDPITRAIKIAEFFHKHQTDKAGSPYIEHIWRVAENSRISNSDEMITAFLHDILEKTELKESDLIEAGFAPEVIDAVKLLTKSKSKKFDETQYIKKISQNVAARTVKLAELEDNLNISRLKYYNSPDIKRQSKYRDQYHKLDNVI